MAAFLWIEHKAHRHAMSWHEIPKDDAWRQVTLAHVEGLGQRLWLRCNSCGHEVVADPASFGAVNNLRLDTPLLLIARRLKCSRCGERKVHCWPEPYAIKGA